MSLKQDTRDNIKYELNRRIEKLPKALGLDEYGITSELMGLNDAFFDRVIDDAYLAIFTEAEVEEMVAFNLRFADRALILEKVVEEAVGKTIESRRDVVLAKLGAK